MPADKLTPLQTPPSTTVKLNTDPGQNTAICFEQYDAVCNRAVFVVGEDRAAALAWVATCSPETLRRVLVVREVDAVVSAWTVEGPHPPHHRAEKRGLFKSWPALANALDALANLRRR